MRRRGIYIKNKEEESTTGIVTVDEDDEIASQHSKIIVDRISSSLSILKGQVYKDIIKCHLSYVKSNYGTATIVFNGYGQMSKITNKEDE